MLAGGGREFRARRAAVGGGEEHWRTRISVLRRGNLTGVDLTAVASYSDAVEGLSHAADGREAAVDGELEITPVTPRGSLFLFAAERIYSPVTAASRPCAAWLSLSNAPP